MLREPARVEAYSGRCGEEDPRTLVEEGRRLELDVIRRWRAPEGRYFEVQDRDGQRHVLLCLEPQLSWWRLGG